MFGIMDMSAFMLAAVDVVIDDKAFGLLAGAIGAGLIVVGAGRGIGELAGRATEAIARQPEMAGRIFTTMIIGAALIEGLALFALIICLLEVVG